MDIIKAMNLKKYYISDTYEVRALDGVSLVVKEGEFIAVVGTSGCGKTSKIEEKLYQTLPMKSAEQKIYVSDTAQYTAVSKLSGGYELVILGTLAF